MSLELAYFLKINIAIALFFAFYRLFFYADTFFQWRRTALLCFFGISLFYPFLNIQEWVRGQEPIAVIADIYAAVIFPVTVNGSPAGSGTAWEHLILSSLGYIYVGVSLLLLCRFFYQLFGIFRLVLRTPVRMLQQSKVHTLDSPQGPFSFFHWIFICPEAHTKEETEEILTHEQAHARQWHSVDILLSELMCIFCWFNPFVWLMKYEVRNNLEFLADYKVLENGHNYKIYQHHLLDLVCRKEVATLYNSFNVLPLKKRINMMNKKRTKQIGRTKYLIFFPLAVLLLVISNIEAIARSTEKQMDRVEETLSVAPAVAIQQNQQQSKVVSDSISKIKKEANDDNLPYEIVETMPEFPGGNVALMKFLSTNIKYPQNAVKNRVQGRVVVQFVVDKNGNVIKPSVVRPVDSELDAEALRVMSLMPTWIPGKQKGKNVSVRYTVPISFRLPVEKETPK